MSEFFFDTLDITPPSNIRGLSRSGLIRAIKDKPKKLNVVQAPPGYGKTEFLGQLYHSIGGNSVWINIREKDRDPIVFLRKIDEAMRLVSQKDLKRKYPHVFDGHTPPSLSPWLINIINEMNSVDKLHVFLNDCDLLNNSKSNKLLDELLRDTGLTVKLYVTTITDIQIKHSYLAMDSQLTVISQDQLQFGRTDIATLFFQENGVKACDEFISKVLSLTEGWPVAVNYFLTNMTDKKEIDDFMSRFKYENIDFDRYFMENVFDNHTQSTKKLILRLCLLDRFNINLCLLFSDDEFEGKNFFSHIKDSVFVSSDEGSTTWFRFHRLFIVFLKKKSTELLSNHERGNCRMEAARWFMGQDHIEEAIGLAFSSDNLSQAAVWLEYAFPYIVLKNGHHDIFLRWIDRLPESVLKDHPIARVGAIWSLSLSRKTTLAFEQITILESIKDSYCDEIKNQIDRTIGLSICADKALKDEVSGVTEEISAWIDKWADLSLYNNPNEYHFEVGIAYLVKGYCKKCISEFDDARSALLQSQKHFLARDNYYGLTWSKSMLAVSYAKQGFHYEALQEAHSGYTYAKDNLGEKSHLGFGLAALISAINYEYDEIETAKVYMVDVIDYLKEQGSTDLLIAGFEIKAKLLFEDGLKNEAVGFLKDCIRWAEEHLLYRLMLRMVDELTILLIRLRRSMEAEQYMSQYNIVLKSANDFDIQNDAHKISARCIVLFFIDRNKYDDALEILNLLVIRSMNTNLQRRSAEWYKLFGIVHYLKNNNDLAIEALDKSLDIAVPQDYLRMFIDSADQVFPLLQLYIDKNDNSKKTRFVEKIQKIMSTKEKDCIGSLVEGLTIKEIEIVRLLQLGMTNKKNSEKLGISEGTLKWHLHNIYTKFLVKNRAQALIKAGDLGYLSDD